MLAEYVFKSKYARYNAEAGRRETWSEAVKRTAQMHRARFPHEAAQIDEVEGALERREILPSMRGLQFAGAGVTRKNMRLYNCTSSYCDRPRFFAEALWLLLAGSGVGFSVQRHHTDKLPPISAPMSSAPYTVADSIEGWADATHALISAYMSGAPRPLFDFSQVRPAGSPLSVGGTAPGPEPLRLALEGIEQVLRGAEGRRLRPIEAFDCAMYLADCTRTAGTRRSATIAIFDADDEEMINAKTAPEWYITHPHRARANISAVITPDTPRERYSELFRAARTYGEPGLVYLDSTEWAVNPCVAGDTLVLTERGYRRIRDLKQSTLIIDPRFGKGLKGDTSARGGFMTAPLKQLYLLKTREGFTVECTADHQIMTSRGWVEAAQLTQGDLIHIGNARGAQPFGDKFTAEQGLILGWLLGDGCVISPTQGRLYFYGQKRSLMRLFEQITGGRVCEQGALDRAYVDFPLALLADIKTEWATDTKRDLPDALYQGSESFLSAFIRALFSADGSVQGDSAKGLSARLTQTHLQLLQTVQRILLQFGVFGRIYEERRPQGIAQLPDGKGGLAPYPVRAVHELCISRDSLNAYAERIGFICDKQQLLNDRLAQRTRKPYADRFTAQFQSFEPTKTAPVYDLTQPDTSSFIANGLVVHNCVEILMCPTHIKHDGEQVERYTVELLNPARRAEWEAQGYRFESGWSACNLSTVNVAAARDAAHLAELARLASRLGTYQASYTDTGYLGATSRAIIEREALLGVSLCGMAARPDLTLDAETLEKAARAAVQENADTAARIGTRQASRVTCVKPEGTASLVLGTSSGIHPAHARRYLRRVQASERESVFQAYRATNPLAVEKSAWGSDYAAIFACEGRGTTRDELTALDLLARARVALSAWVKPGTARPQRLVGACHNVSLTVSVQPDEWEAVEADLWEHRASYRGVSLLGASGDYDYPQAPFQAIYTDEEIDAMNPTPERRATMIEARALWELIKRSAQPVDYEAQLEGEDTTAPLAVDACAGGMCELK